METGLSNFRSGFAVLAGRTNVGKSTLVNALVGKKVAIVSPKPQTTRDTYQGIVHRPGGQIILVDTPGTFQTAAGKLVDNLRRRASAALKGADVVVYVADPSRSIGEEEQSALRMVDKLRQPKILCLNKLDLPQRPFRDFWLERASRYQATVEVSALKKTNMEELVQAILCRLPPGPAYYPEGDVSNVTNEFLFAEMIREKVYLLTAEEVPYTATVRVEKVEERNDKAGNPMLCVKASILAIDDRRQRMLIGQGGRKVKEIGIAARKELEAAVKKKVFLELSVLVDRRWIERMG